MKYQNPVRRALAVAAFLGLAAYQPASAQSVAEFYKGKTIQFFVGYETGGGYDASTRAAARFIGKHIPGNPTVIVNNMPGASSLTFVRYLSGQAPKDGTQFGMFDRALISRSVLDPKGTNVDFRDFTWIGSMSSDVGICFLRGGKNLTTIAEIGKSQDPVIFGGTSKNASGYIYSSMIRRLSPQNVKQVLGYAGTTALLLANERSEIDGNCSTLAGLQTAQPTWIAEKKVNVVVQFAERRHPELQNVQTIFEVVQSEQDKQAIRFLTAAEEIGRPIIGPPGMQADRAEAIRKAFLDTMKDPELLAFAQQAKMEIAPIDGPRAAKIAADIVMTPSEAIELARKLME